MTLKQLRLINFRNHKKANFDLSNTSVIIGRNTAGKTNILEAIFILSRGKSFRAEHDRDTIREGAEFTRIEAEIMDEAEKTDLKAVFSLQKGYLSKKFLVNNVARRQHDFTSNFVSILFTPKDIEILTDSPGVRRRYIDSVLYQSDRSYRTALSVYERALKHRNRMLSDMKDGKKTYERHDFEYFENILVEQGNILTSKRQEFVDFVNGANKDIFKFTLFYDKSIMSVERLFRYHFEEQAAGVTLVGPQRDDYTFYFEGTEKPVKEFGSRGEERLTILQLKTLEIEFLRLKTGKNPVLLLDDIFSELDDANIFKVFELLPHQQTILTTTHHEFVPKKILTRADVKIIEL